MVFLFSFLDLDGTYHSNPQHFLQNKGLTAKLQSRNSCLLLLSPNFLYFHSISAESQVHLYLTILHYFFLFEANYEAVDGKLACLNHS